MRQVKLQAVEAQEAKLQSDEGREAPDKLKKPLRVYSRGSKKGRPMFSSIPSSTKALDSDPRHSLDSPIQSETIPHPSAFRIGTGFCVNPSQSKSYSLKVLPSFIL